MPGPSAIPPERIYQVEHVRADLYVGGAVSFETVLRDVGMTTKRLSGASLRLGHDRLFVVARRMGSEFYFREFLNLMPMPKWQASIYADPPYDSSSFAEWSEILGSFLAGVHAHPGTTNWMVVSGHRPVASYVKRAAVVNEQMESDTHPFIEYLALESMKLFTEAEHGYELLDLGFGDPY